MNDEPKERWALVFQAEGPGQPLPMRIKLLLKRALRQHGLRCCDYWIVNDDAPRKTRPYVDSGGHCDHRTCQNPTDGAKRATSDIRGRNGDIDPEGVEQ